MGENLTPLEKVEMAVESIKKGRKKLTITEIAKRAGIARKTIYNRPELKQRCDQEILFQKQAMLKDGSNEKKTRNKPKTKYKLLEKRYNKLKKELEIQRKNNMKLLNNNKELVLDKEQLNTKIIMLKRKIERMNKSKVKKMP